ncbi:MAG TPA: poly(R)-hydroxyalkanoic acid synthase subunit PhaE [Pyrinomonadaceae bacterium]|jgi:polyhydroxyalkanoate synthesis regulator phasin
MSDDKKSEPLQAFRNMYDQMFKQTGEQWEELARNPLFLANMANNFEQSMKMQAQAQEMVIEALKALNLPTREDILNLSQKIDSLREEVAGLKKTLKETSPKEQSSTKSKRIKR